MAHRRPTPFYGKRGLENKMNSLQGGDTPLLDDPGRIVHVRT